MRGRLLPQTLEHYPVHSIACAIDWSKPTPTRPFVGWPIIAAACHERTLGAFVAQRGRSLRL